MKISLRNLLEISLAISEFANNFFAKTIWKPENVFPTILNTNNSVYVVLKKVHYDKLRVVLRAKKISGYQIFQNYL